MLSGRSVTHNTLTSPELLGLVSPLLHLILVDQPEEHKQGVKPHCPANGLNSGTASVRSGRFNLSGSEFSAEVVSETLEWRGGEMDDGEERKEKP